MFWVGGLQSREDNFGGGEPMSSERLWGSCPVPGALEGSSHVVSWSGTEHNQAPTDETLELELGGRAADQLLRNRDPQLQSHLLPRWLLFGSRVFGTYYVLRHYFADKGPPSHSYGFSCSQVWM